MPRSFAIKLAITFVAVLALRVQPNWLPLLRLNELQNAAPGSTLLTKDLIEAIEDAYLRQPWRGDRAEAAGLAALAVGDYDSAQIRLGAAVGIKGWTPNLRSAMGDAHKGSGDLTKAIEQWELALPDKGTDPYLLAKLSNAYESLGRYDDASAMLRTLVAIQPDNAIARYRFGAILAITDPASAPAHLEVAAALDESVKPLADSLKKAVAAGLDSDDPAYNAGVIGYTLVGLQEYALAKQSLLNAITAKPDFAQAHAYLGLAEDRLGNNGLYAYQRALALDDNLALSHYLLGLHYRRQRDNAQAIPALKRAFELDPSYASAAAELGSAYVEEADLQTAELWYAQAVNIAPDDASFWLLLAQFYLDNELKVAEAGLPSAQQAAALAPESAAALDAVGYGYYLLGQFDLAEPELLKAQALDSRSAKVYFHLGLLYLDTDRPTEAKFALETTIGLDPEGPLAGSALTAMARLGISPGISPTPAP